MAQWVKNSPVMQETQETGSIPGLGRQPGGGNGNPLHILAWKFSQTEELLDYNPQGHKESDMTEWLNTHFSQAETVCHRLVVEPNVAGTQTQPKPQYLVLGPNEAQVLDILSQKEFSERQSDR